ncbi:hypothetical protein N7517_001104 [Penicillium concentricum]|uniref:Uncharacterized protein n=1 Tax=Penicillium concentricum TaxID=293559 RepID=A0A9W9SR90_9EURO|nr:uncharacterized protein N7517_001104 [Penicillium concentricum]KAJ5383193.1 hypothetical protein N7517_001104 [Penicillium concentricum]
MNKSTLSSIVLSFEAIPTELAHQIIDDLRVWDVLKLLCYQNDRVDECIISHPICRTIIGSDHETISRTRFATIFYIDFFSKLGKKLLPYPGCLLGFNIHCEKDWKTDQILDTMHSRLHYEIREHWRKIDLTRFGASKNISFANWRPPQNGYSFEEMKKHWDDIQTAKVTPFKQMAEELRWAADILEANPDILKRTLDPGQEIRPNTAHIVSRMRRNAAKIVRSPKEKFVSSEHFSVVFVPVIPFDSALNEMLYFMQSQGIIMGNRVVTDSLPSLVTKLVHVVICGMPRFYLSPLETEELSQMKQRPTVNEKGEILRTGNTLWSEQVKTPISIDGSFFTPFKTDSARSFRRPVPYKWDPHSEMEKEWLESFVGLYRYLKEVGK